MTALEKIPSSVAATKLLIVGPSLDSTCNYQQQCCDRVADYCKGICKHLGDEIFGDIFASSLLMLAYKENAIQMWDNGIVCLGAIDHFMDFNEPEH